MVATNVSFGGKDFAKILKTESRTSHLKMYASLCRTCGSIILFPDVTLERCALNAWIHHFVLSFSISYWDLIKFPSFADTTKRGDKGWKEAQRQGDFTDNSIGWRLSQNLMPNLFFPLRAQPASQPANKWDSNFGFLLDSLFYSEERKQVTALFELFTLPKNSQRHNFVLEKLRCLSLSLTYHSPILTISWKKQRDHGLLDGFLMLVLPQAPQPLSLSLSLSLSLQSALIACNAMLPT